MIKKKKTVIEPDLLIAYLSANYHVYSEQPFIFKVSQYSAELKKLMHKFKKKSAAFITAFNPQSEELNLKENKIRNQQLELEIQRFNFNYIKGDGRCDESDKVGEESYLIFGITQEQSTNLGINYNQNAIIWCSEDARPQLLLIR
ncbi:DUF3293 domain-containing protein [Methylophilaceae bacterium]|jgi:hypothetical protein|nr:DUF3293 domain-containing protein [Methylophilaceae bacterium]|tara:strand:- start:852 stop:1286 length:435 start_codon:yes stop_codon:yes gene_type:complete